MADTTCLILILLLLVGFIIYNYFTYQKDIDNLKTQLNNCKSTQSKQNQDNFNYDNFNGYDQRILIPPPVIKDPVKTYDINNIGNPLIYPTTRPPSTIFTSLMDNPLFFYPTRGYPDRPNYIGNLIEINKNDNNNPQLPSVLQLIGQQKYPGSSKYDYYVLLPSSGNNPPIKYIIKTDRNEELYNGDIVKILDKSYTVEKNKSPFEYFV